MAMDAYAPCPCGSGKKLKFCCAGIVDDMTKVVRLQANDQPRQALQILEKLEKSNPDNPWVVTTHAEILIGMREAGSAKDRLEQLLKTQPDYPPAYAGLALASLFADGYESARPAIHRAFQKCVIRFPRNVGLLALAIATVMENGRHDMAARQYLTLAMRLMGEEAREDVFVMLLRWDGNPEIPYPIRSVHNLIPYPTTGPNAAEAAKAVAFVNIGCWGPAGRAFTRITESEPDNAFMWWNAGLCRAWDADEAGAAEAFHRAAATSSEYEFAVESETLAQLSDLKATAEFVPFTEVHFPLRSASRLLGLLDGNDRISPAPRDEQDEDEIPLAGEFLIRDKPLPSETDAEHLTFEQIPTIAATLEIYDGVPDRGLGPTAVLHGQADQLFDSARELFEGLAKDEITGPGTAQDEHPAGRIPREQAPFFRMWQLPSGLSLTARHKLMELRWQQLVDNVWMNGPQKGLDGKSPSAVKGDPQFRVRLAAAVYVLDSVAQRLGARFDLETFFGRLGLEPLKPLDPTGNTTLSSLSPMQLHRVPVKQLSDEQLVHAHRRAMLIGHRRFVEPVLREILSRPQCVEKVDVDRIYQTLVAIARDEGRLDDAIAGTLGAKEHAGKQPNAFELTLTWTITEFGLRSEKADDPELPQLFRHLSEYYAPKVPQVAALVEVFRQQFADRFPWLKTADLLVGSGVGGTSPSGGLWTPGAASPPTSGKLWLPGQE